MDKRDYDDLFDEVTDKIRRILWIIIALMLIMFGFVLIFKIAKADTYTCAVHKGEWVWIRETPDPHGRQIGRVRFGYEVESGEPENGYLAIDTQPGWMLEGEKGFRGYVDASYFDRAIPEKMYRVNTEGGPLAKRETPEGRLMCWIKPGVKISVLAWRYSKSGELWAKVFRGGYVKAEYLSEL